MLNTVKLKQYNNDHYQSGSTLKKLLWYFINMFFFKATLPFPSGIKVSLLHMFGAKVGEGVVIKPDVNMKYPWFLEIGDDCWIGEGVWIDNLAQVTIGSDVVLSQGVAMTTRERHLTLSLAR